MLRNRRELVCATLAVWSLWAVARPGGQTPQPRPQGWAVRQSLTSSGTLYNNVKQKLLDGKQVTTFAINRPDTKLYCEAAQHYDYIWFEMQHSTMTFKDVEEMIAACPRPVATPVIRIPDESEGNIQKATDIGALGIVIPTVDTPEKAMNAARYARYPPEGRRSVGAGQAGSIWGVNGINYRNTVNDNMLVIVQIETPIGAWNSYAIANQPGVDVVLASNGDMTNFSGYQPADPQYQLLFTQIHDGVLRAGKFLGAVTSTYGRPGPPGTGRPTSRTGGCSIQGQRSTAGSRLGRPDSALPGPTET